MFINVSVIFPSTISKFKYCHVNNVLILSSLDGGSAALGIELLRGSAGGLYSSLSSSNSGPEQKKPVTAQERQREREEKRRKKQERAMEKKRKLKEKEKKEGKQGKSLGGMLLSDNDKKLLERWGRMMDKRVDKSQTVETSSAKTSEGKTVQIQTAKARNVIKTNSDMGESMAPTQPNEVQTFKPPQILTQMGPCLAAGIFHPTPTHDAQPVSLGPAQNGDVGLVAVGGGGSAGVVTAPCAFAKNNTLKPQFLTDGTMFTNLENWTGTPHQPQKSHQPPPELNNPAHTGFAHMQAQPKPVTHAQSQSNAHIQLLPLESFMTKPSALNPSIGVSDTSTSLSNPEISNGPQALDKLCILEERQNGSHAQGPSKQPPGAAAQPCLGLTDTGQPANSIPDIHTVTQQLSKSQVNILCIIRDRGPSSSMSVFIFFQVKVCLLRKVKPVII